MFNLGCGGTGIEILKLCPLDKYDITIIDKDIVDITNLNRLFTFTEKDIGSFKSELLYKIYNVKYLIQDILTLESIAEWDIIIIAVDNLTCRIHLNYLYKLEGKGILLDCGVSKNMCHIFKVTSSSFCLYCISEMYEINEGDGASCSKNVSSSKLIRPSVCYINSICASLVFLMLDDLNNNYYFYNGTKNIFFSKMKIKRNVNCILCMKL